MVSGNFDPKVSGMIMAKIPAIRLDTPIMISGASPFMAAKIGAAIPPILNKIKRLVFNKIHLTIYLFFPELLIHFFIFLYKGPSIYDVR